MTTKHRWAAISVAIYVVFILAAVVIGFLNPARIGLQWTIFWVVAVAGLCYYFYFKNISYRVVIYYAKKLDLHKADLASLVPNLKDTQDVPDPDRPNLLSPFVGIPISVTNQLTEQLIDQAQQANIPPFQ